MERREGKEGEEREGGELVECLLVKSTILGTIRHRVRNPKKLLEKISLLPNNS